MLGACSVNTHLPGIPARAAVSAAALTTLAGSPERSSFLSMTRRYALVSLRRFSENVRPRTDISLLMARRRSFCSGPRLAPPRTKSL